MNKTKMRKHAEFLAWRRVPQAAVDEFYEKYAKRVEEAWLKEGFDTHNVLEAMNLVPGHFPGGIPNSPGPLQSMLVSGLAGAGLGYGAGYLGEKLLPSNWERGKLRRTLALMGGAMGAAPGLALGLNNVVNSRSFQDKGYTPTRQHLDLPKHTPGLAEGLSLQPPEGGQAAPDNFDQYATDHIKESYYQSRDLLEGAGGDDFPPVPVDEFNEVIWGDPRVANRLQPSVQAAATGLITGAAHLPGRDGARLVSPFDVARIAAGMGSGYASGAVVGKALGVLMGMPDSTQDKLKNTGLFAGIIANLIPIAFGG